VRRGIRRQYPPLSGRRAVTCLLYFVRTVVVSSVKSWRLGGGYGPWLLPIGAPQGPCLVKGCSQPRCRLSERVSHALLHRSIPSHVREAAPRTVHKSVKCRSVVEAAVKRSTDSISGICEAQHVVRTGFQVE
jgi:hypothetical protein